MSLLARIIDLRQRELWKKPDMDLELLQVMDLLLLDNRWMFDDDNDEGCCVNNNGGVISMGVKHTRNVMVPPSGVNFIALDMKLRSTWDILNLSKLIKSVLFTGKEPTTDGSDNSKLMVISLPRAGV